jgi:hypothetical protein
VWVAETQAIVDGRHVGTKLVVVFVGWSVFWLAIVLKLNVSFTVNQL